MEPSPSDITDYTQSSSISEVDSLSDSDWLDISSNRESDDNDSVSSRDSDHDEVGSMPPSRRSSISLGSSRDGDVEAWEGFADDSADEGTPDDIPVNALAFAADDVESTPAGDISGIERDPAEEQRVKDALDQSMISTLSSSRTSSTGLHSSTVHNSLRDLRLSFPDPLTSSRDELNRSYEDLSPTETTFSTTDGEDAPLSVTVITSDSTQKEDLSSLTTPHIPHFQVRPYWRYNAELDVVLYGCASPMKWSFVDTLIQKAAAGGGRILSSTTQLDESSTRWLHLKQANDESFRSPSFVAVHDRTEGNSTPLSVDQQHRPSLAVVYLPSDPLSLPRHTFYLPVLAPSTPLIDSPDIDASSRKAAQDMWDLLAIPTSKTLRLKESGDSYLFDSRDLRQLEPLHAHNVLQQLSRRPSKVFSMTLLALVSLILGLIVNAASRTSAPPPTPTPGISSSNNSWGVIGPSINHSVIRTADANVAVIPSSLKDFALAVFKPATASTTPPPRIRPTTGCGTGTAKPPGCQCKIPTWSEKVKSSKDIILRPVPSALSLSGPSKVRTPAASKFVASAEGSSSALSIKLVDSLSEIADITMKALVEVFQPDLRELMEALDDLMRAIGYQTSAIMKQSKGRAAILREHLQYRNERARGKARQLKEMGGQLISFAGEKLKGRAETAKERARALKKYIATSEAWRSYRKAHGESAARIIKDLKDRTKKGKRVIKNKGNVKARGLFS